MTKSSNPALGAKVFSRTAQSGQSVMTIGGAVNKTLILLLFVFIGASWSWSKVFYVWEPLMSEVQSIAIWGSIIAFVVALVTIFKAEWSPYTAPAYALIEGAAVGALSALMELAFPDIVIQAVGLTFGVAFVMLAAYKTRIIRATDKFKLGVTAATGSIFLIYMLTFILGFFDITVPFVHEGGTFGILFSLFVVTIAALNLIMDFDFIETAASKGLPKYMEWYSAFGLMVTLIWLYLEILRLLAKSRSRN